MEYTLCPKVRFYIIIIYTGCTEPYVSIAGVGYLDVSSYEKGDLRMTGKKKISPMNTASILSLFLVSMGVTIVTPAMATLAQHFEGKDVSWISTLPPLVQ